MKNFKLMSTLAVTAMAIAACNTTAPTVGAAAPVPASASEQAFLDSSATSPHYNVMLSTVDGLVEGVKDTVDANVDTSVDVKAGGVKADVDASTSTSTGTTIETMTSTGVAASASSSLETPGMLSHGKLVKLATTVTADTNRAGSWFQASNLTDGNLHSAWGPNGTDANPTLTFNLSSCTTVRALGLKQSGGATFDVAVSQGNGAYTVIGTNLTSTATLLDWIDLKATQADKVQLRFHNASKLLVCEVQWFGDDCASMPSTAPSTMPSASASPSTQPSASPSADASASPAVSPSPVATATPTPVPSATTTTDPAASSTAM